MSDAQLQRFMKKQYMINRQILKCLREIDEELDFDSDQFGCSDLDELIPPSIRVFFSESTLRMRWPKYWSFQL